MGADKVDGVGSPDVEMIENHGGIDDVKKGYPDAYLAPDSNTRLKSKAEKRLLLKADVCIVPLAALCYLVSYLVSFTLSHLQDGC
jgi:hypothetical protein